MISRRNLILIAASSIMLIPLAAAAANDIRTFSPADFDAARKAGKSILVEVHADWCPTCKAQAPIISELRKEPRFKELVVFRVDFDSQKEAVKQFGARSQSTLIAFKGNTEAGRSVGDTNKASIGALLAKTL
ncbi:thioredoxin family protein [Bosea sp. LjRoot237]|uniref:thioredoxin family protein n=1 Tax=Bosea sp. LjRoot237 TaxID=3342292 RepID=UPI003ECD9EBA